VVIVGAGFGGLTCARALKRAPVQVTLIDRNNYHLFTPLLYQVASALLDPAEVARPVRSLVRPLANVDFRLGNVERIDLEARRVVTDRGDVPYDYLVMAAGSQTNYFGNRSLEAAAHGLKELPEALTLRNLVLRRFESSAWETDEETRKRQLTFVVVGGGPTGVEYAGAISELIRLVLARDMPGLDPEEPRVVLLEAADSLLGAFDPRLRAAAERALRRKGVEVRCGTQVAGVREGWLELGGGGRLPAATVVWTAGVRASDLAPGLAAAAEVVPGRQGRIPVDTALRLPGHDDVFVIGDLASYEVDGQALPMLIPVAMQQARHAARSIRDLIQDRRPRAFRYRDPGIMATIGRNAAVAQIGRLRLSGFPGWLLWLGVHLVNVVSFRSRLLVLINWAWEYLLFDRPVRLIVAARPEDPDSDRLSDRGRQPRKKR
jgi:NADH dehydrogenase